MSRRRVETNHPHSSGFFPGRRSIDRVRLGRFLFLSRRVGRSSRERASSGPVPRNVWNGFPRLGTSCLRRYHRPLTNRPPRSRPQAPHAHAQGASGPKARTLSSRRAIPVRPMGRKGETVCGVNAGYGVRKPCARTSTSASDIAYCRQATASRARRGTSGTMHRCGFRRAWVHAWKNCSVVLTDAGSCPSDNAPPA